MPAYEVKHGYRSRRDGQDYGPWEAGQTVELTEADAEWVNRDSPGCLAEAEPAKADKPERAKQPAADRQHRGGANRGA